MLSSVGTVLHCNPHRLIHIPNSTTDFLKPLFSEFFIAHSNWVKLCSTNLPSKPRIFSIAEDKRFLNNQMKQGRFFVKQRFKVEYVDAASDEESGCENSSSSTEPKPTVSLQKVHISPQLMEDFLELARDNTEKDLETCGALGAFLERGTFYVTTLIIPKQESTSNSCQVKNDEEVFKSNTNVHFSLLDGSMYETHPSQSCFLSSIDLHTQYSYQMMVPEAFAIVMAPTDTSRSYGFFRLTDPNGMEVLRQCQEDGSFHPHKETTDGVPLYHQCTNVYKNSNLRFEIF